MKVSIIDSGICPHIDISEDIFKNKKCFISGELNTYGDMTGHGTHMAGLVHKYSPDSELYIAKVLNENNTGDDIHLINAIEWSIKNKCDIINISMANQNTPPKITHEIIKHAINKNIIIVAAGGNNFNKVCYPAKYPEVIGVTSINSSKELSSFSYLDKSIDVAAIGENVNSTWLGNQYKVISGTSQATAIVTGLIANILKKNKDLNKQQIKQELYDKYSNIIKIF